VKFAKVLNLTCNDDPGAKLTVVGAALAEDGRLLVVTNCATCGATVCFDMERIIVALYTDHDKSSDN